MGERTKAILNLFVNCLTAAAGGAMTAVSTADGPNAFKRPFVWLSIAATVLPVIRATLNESPQSGAAIDRYNGK